MTETPHLEPIAQDRRGANWSLLLPNGGELILIYTRKGMYRGGHSHDKPETNLMLSGRIKYWKMHPDGRETEFELGPGETSHNEPGEAHLALALEDYWLVEWKIGVKAGESRTISYPPYRKKVEDQLKGDTQPPK